MGGKVVHVDGEVTNLKVTTPDRPRAGRGVDRRRSAGPYGPAGVITSRWSAVTLRVGQGFDVHAFSDDPGRPLMLGGVAVPGRGLKGHSDADVVCHAIIDAVLGAAGAGDIGTMFPDTSPAWAGADSLELLVSARERIALDLESGKRRLHRDRRGTAPGRLPRDRWNGA